MATDIQIQTGVRSDMHMPPVRDSAGVLYVLYVKGSTEVFMAYSIDAGLTWNEVASGSTIGSAQISYAIDGTDTIHVVYQKSADSKLYYRPINAFTWGSEEAVSTNTVDAQVFCISVAVDSLDIPHTVWRRASDDDIYYSNRSGGTWSAELNIATTSSPRSTSIVFDSNDDIYVIFNESNTSILYVKYTSFWTSPVTIASTAGSAVSSVVDSADNVYVVWNTGNVVNYKYVKYTKSSDTWGVAVTVTTTLAANDPSVMLDSSDNFSVFFGNAATKLLYSAGFAVESTLVTVPVGSAIASCALSPIFPIVGGYESNVPDVGYHLTYCVSTLDSLRYYASADLTMPAPATQNYSRKSNGSLPSGDSSLTNLFISAEYAEVAVADSSYADQTATDQYAIFLFKNKGNSSSDEIHVSWTGKTTIACTVSPIYLQIYNRNSGLWETLVSDALSAANANLTLTGGKTSSLSDYYDGNNWVSCRVYQLAQ